MSIAISRTTVSPIEAIASALLAVANMSYIPPACISEKSIVEIPIEPPTKKQRRIAITDAERRDLRRQNYIVTQGEISQKALQRWFMEKYGRTLRQSTISERLSPAFSRLDDLRRPVYPDRKRHKEGQWPDLEACLFE